MVSMLKFNETDKCLRKECKYYLYITVTIAGRHE